MAIPSYRNSVTGDAWQPFRRDPYTYLRILAIGVVIGILSWERPGNPYVWNHAGIAITVAIAILSWQSPRDP